MKMIDRRALLKTRPNPDKGLDYVITLKGCITKLHAPLIISVRYIPDKYVLNANDFENYITALGTQSWETPEDFAVSVLTDVNNEIVTRWVQVFLNTQNDPHSTTLSHTVMIEDRQPGWDNPNLLARLERV